jgi:hypothetical protein
MSEINRLETLLKKYFQIINEAVNAATPAPAQQQLNTQAPKLVAPFVASPQTHQENNHQH